MNDLYDGGVDALKLRLPAEWEMGGGVILAWPHPETDWNYMLDDVRACVVEMIHAISRWTRVVVLAPDIAAARREIGTADPEKVFFFETPTNDTWTRDYGPLSVELSDGSFAALDFRFNGWGLKFAACHDNLVTGRMSRSGLIGSPVVNCQDFVLEGGGIESDGNGLLMTTSECQCSPNRNPVLDRDGIEKRLLGYFGAEKIIWLNHGYLAGDDTDSHIDTLARFAPGNTIIFTGCDDPSDEHFSELQAMEAELRDARDLSGKPFNLIRLPLPDAIYDEDGERLPATYANFLALPEVVLMPVYGQPKKDELARQMLQIAFHQPVVAIDCRALIRQHGSLHCMTMQFPDGLLSF
ncbi:MAG: agmatine deiminase family protein [Paramuribaculum sp.]|nr:agmatine deiminase family protein [Paramuribaculum sp.]MDE6488433.1 agmatine deiminase family protein [Paramuribaculum sp.]